MRRAAQLLKDIEAARLRMKREPRGRAENRCADARSVTQEMEPTQEVATPLNTVVAVYEPTSYKRAMSKKEHNAWVSDTQHEFNSHIHNGTWELVPRQPHMDVIGSSWKFKLKRDQSKFISKYKARLVARGVMQEMNWTSVFAPTLRYTSLRVILALASHHDYEIEQMGVVTAFLNANVVSEIYMDQPQGFRKTAKDGGELVRKLKKALYGIREAPRAWNSLLSEWRIRIGFK